VPEEIWAVPADHPAFAGHFPGRPILPGVVILDRIICLATRIAGRPEAGARIGSAKFFHPVTSGQALVLQVENPEQGAVRFQVLAEGKVVAAGTIEWAAPAP
jgi:3-hydroxyacyl-[acyl-carrier-protein] dehydratase